MSHVIPWTRRPPLTLVLALGALSAGACTDASSPVSTVDVETSYAHLTPDVASAQKDLAAVRRATARFHSFEEAGPAGWDFQATECMEHPTEGGMGYHYGNLGYYLDGEANPLEPEVLLYEPGPDGKLRLVAVEYLVPFFAWAGDPDTDDPPQLFGQDMKRDDEHGEWLLHVWIWKDNPNGMFADWNPRVSCEHA